MKYTHLLALILSLALLAVACGGEASVPVESSSPTAAEGDADDSGSEGTGDEGDDGDGEAGESASQGSAVENGATPMAASSPIGAYFANDGGFDDAIAEFTVKVEEEIIKCMAADGFEFAASGTFTDDPVTDRQNELTVREWTSEFGFGISTSFDSVAENQTDDPNAAILFSMGEAERELWVKQLTGGSFEDFAGPGDQDRPLEDQGCIGQALIATGGAEVFDGMSEFGDAYDEGEAALFERREMVEAVDAWTTCMSEAGFPGYGALDDPEDEISKRFDEVLAPLSAAIDTLSDEEAQALISGESFDIADLPDLDVTALRDLQQEEIALALVDLDCYEAEVQATYEPLRDEFENGLLVEYATEFDAVLNIGN